MTFSKKFSYFLLFFFSSLSLIYSYWILPSIIISNNLTGFSFRLWFFLHNLLFLQFILLHPQSSFLTASIRCHRILLFSLDCDYFFFYGIFLLSLVLLVSSSLSSIFNPLHPTLNHHFQQSTFFFLILQCHRCQLKIKSIFFTFFSET